LMYLGWLLPSLNGCVIPEQREEIDQGENARIFLFSVSFCCGCGVCLWYVGAFRNRPTTDSGDRSWGKEMM
jgi:hypothetical protein